MSQLDKLIKQFNREYKETVISKGMERIQTKKIPFSSPRANYMTYGGLPRGRLIEFAGEENGGKTTTALDITKNAQELFKDEWRDEIERLTQIEKPTKEQLARIDYLDARGPYKVVYADCENTLDEQWAELLGVDIDSMVLLKPQSQTAEQIFDMILALIETEEVGLVVIDSLGVMLSAQAYEKSMEEKTYGGIAMALTLFSKKAEMLCAKTGCTLIGINQMRDNLSSPYGGQITTGGRAWKHNCSLRMMFKKGDYLDTDGKTLRRSAENPQGNQVEMSIVKTKIFKPDRRNGFYTLMYHTGIDAISDTVDTAIQFGLINQAGAWFTLVDLDTGEIRSDDDGELIKIQGRLNMIEWLKNHPDYYMEILDNLDNLITR